MAVADIFDALYSDRPYRMKMTIEAAKEIVTKDVHSRCLDERVVIALYELIAVNELMQVFE